jgi:CRISPR-associated protein Cas5d
MKVERMSYEVMTPSAARGVLEAILWKPAIVWEVHEIAVCAPIRWTSFRRNEVNSVASKPKTYLADEDRAQRNTVALRDVDYVITATFVMTAKAAEGDTRIKFEEMFERRLQKGQRFHAPYLGCRELAADVSPVAGDVKAIEPGVTRPLGLVFYDFDYRTTPPRPLFFEARLESGVLRVPERHEVWAENGVAP